MPPRVQGSPGGNGAFWFREADLRSDFLEHQSNRQISSKSKSGIWHKWVSKDRRTTWNEEARQTNVNIPLKTETLFAEGLALIPSRHGGHEPTQNDVHFAPETFCPTNLGTLLGYHDHQRDLLQALEVPRHWTYAYTSRNAFRVWSEDWSSNILQ